MNKDSKSQSNKKTQKTIAYKPVLNDNFFEKAKELNLLIGEFCVKNEISPISISVLLEYILGVIKSSLLKEFIKFSQRNENV